MARLKKNGSPHILTLNGKAVCVVQDPNAYQKMLAKLDKLERLVLQSGLSE